MRKAFLLLLSFTFLLNNAVASDKPSGATEQLEKVTKDSSIKKGYDFDRMFNKAGTQSKNKADNSIDVSKFKKDADDEYDQVKSDYYYKHEYVPPERVNSVVSGSCYAINNNDDLKNDCIANIKNDDNWCFSINSKNLMNSCLGQVKRDSSYCFSVNDNDMKNACLASTKRDSSYCFSANNEDIKNSCLAETKYERDWCFSIKNTNIKNACLAIVN